MQTFFIAPLGYSSSITSASLGLITALEQAGLKVGFVKPIGQYLQTEKVTRSNHFVRNLFNREVPSALPPSELERLLNSDAIDDLMEEVMNRYHAVEKDVDIMIVEGIEPDENNPFVADVNTSMVRNLQAGVILVANANGKQPEELAEQIDINVQLYARKGAWFAGYLLNRLHVDLDLSKMQETVALHCKTSEGKSLPLLAAVPNSPDLLAPRTSDIANFLGAKILNAGEIDSRRVEKHVVTARTAINILPLLKPNTLVISPGDREDIMMATALTSLNGMPLSGLLFTSNSVPDERLMELCKPAFKTGLPIMITEHNSYETSNRIGKMGQQVPLDDLERMKRVVNFFAEHVNTKALMAHIDKPKETRMPPSAFRYQLMEKARLANKRIVLPEGEEPRTVKAAILCHQKSIARCVLIGKKDVIADVAKAQGMELPADMEIIDLAEVKSRYVEPLVELRKAKGMTIPTAETQLEDSVMLGTMMLALDEVDGLVSGAIHTTANTIRPALQLIKTAPNAKIVSSIFFMLMPDQVLVYGDCAVNPDPNAEELADIALQSANSAKAFGIDPRVAMISYSTGNSGIGSDVDKVREATAITKERAPDLDIDGPLQYDAASVMSVGQQKAPDSKVAGRATVFVFPDLNTGNTTYKAVQRSANVVSVGPMLQGLRKPVNDLSRGALVDDIVYTIAITAIQATQI